MGSSFFHLVDDAQRALRTLPQHAAHQAESAKINALLNTHPHLACRDYYDPGHLTASAIVVHPDDAHLLVIHHRALGRWVQPGGHLQAEDQSLGHTARREAREETGIELIEAPAQLISIAIHEIPAGSASPAHQHFDFVYLFRATHPTIRANAESSAVAWMHATNCDAYHIDHDFQRHIMFARQRGKLGAARHSS